MKQIKTLGWLVMAAALTTTFAACSSDDNVTEEPAVPVKKTVSVTVGAGITDNATRSTVDYDEEAKTRTLKFTEGDKLFVCARYGNDFVDVDGDRLYKDVLSGYLTMSGSPSADGKNASFSGDLTWYERQSDNTYITSSGIDLPHPDNPLDDTVLLDATLVHKDAVKDTDYDDEGWRILFKYEVLASDVNTLMTKSLELVATTYVSDSKVFRFNTSTSTLPILNCTINGLTADATYNVTYAYAKEETEVDSYSLSSTVTVDGGTANFAFFGMYDEGQVYTHTLTFENTADNSDTKTVTIGTRDLSSYKTKVLNVTRTATAE